MLKAGATREAAAGALGITQTTLYRWIQQGRAGVKPYCDLQEAIEIAESQFIVDSLAVIRQAGEKSWQAIAWILERTHPDQFGQTVIIERQASKALEAFWRLAEERLGSEAVQELFERLGEHPLLGEAPTRSWDAEHRPADPEPAEPEDPPSV